MRKRRVIILEDEPIVLLVFRHLFEMRDYELMAFADPIVCAIHGDDPRVRCDKSAPCADLLITDNRMPKMLGIELLEQQAQRGCKLPPRNKALLSGALDDDLVKRVRELGAKTFPKPLEFDEFNLWLEECEQRMDLEQPLAMKRREVRRPCHEEIRYLVDEEGDALIGLVVNMSWSGLCLRSEKPVDREVTIRLLTQLPVASAVAHVRWTRAVEEGEYLSGLQCL